MSSPKTYSPTIYNVDIKKALQLQASIESCFMQLETLELHDENRKLYFNCKKFTKSNKKIFLKHISPLAVKTTSTSDYSLYKGYIKKINKIESTLNDFLGRIKREEKKFIEIKGDYHSFVSYEEYFYNTINSFKAFQKHTAQYLTSHLKKEYPDLAKKAKSSIEQIKIQIEQAEFEYGFQKKKEEKKDQVINDVKRCEFEINNIRNKINDKVIDDSTKKNMCKLSTDSKPGFKGNNFKGTDNTAKKINERIKDIETLISAVEDLHQQKIYREKFETLLQSQTFNKDEYYYIEFLEDIKKTEKINKWKQKIHHTIINLNHIQVHDNCRNEKEKLLKTALKLTEKQIIKTYEFNDFTTKYKLFKTENQTRIQKDLIQEKESKFIKAQLIQSLQDLNYEVMNDMEVIDFENETDFLFNIPRQSNFLNLRFKPDGTFLYNFLIPGKKTKLSIDSKKQKLEEMESTCNEFKTLLKELSGMGLKVDLTKEMPISEKVLIQVPKKHREIAKKQMQKRETQNIEKVSYKNKTLD